MRAAGVRGEVLPERGLGDLQDQRVVEGPQGGRALAALDEGHLAEAVAGAAHRHLLAGLRDHEVARRGPRTSRGPPRPRGRGPAPGARAISRQAPSEALELGLGRARPGAPSGGGGRACRRAPRSAQASASRSSAAASLTRNPSRSVATIPSLPQRLMMRMQVSIVVPVRSASSWRLSGIGTNRPPVPRPAHPVGELQEEVGEARLDPAARHLGDAPRQLHDALGHAGQEAAHEGGVALEEREELVPADEDALGVLDRDRGGGVGPALVGHHRAHRVAGAEDLEDDLLARGDRLHHLHPAARDRDQEVGRVALGEDRLALLVGPRERHRGEPLLVLAGEVAVERAAPEQLLDGGHRPR